MQQDGGFEMYSTEEAIKKTLQDIDEIEAVNRILPAIKKVVEKWDGKVFNKRFGTDLEALNLPGHIYLSTRYENSWEINYHPENTNNWYTVLHGSKPSCKYYTHDNSFVDENKRVSAEQAFKIIEAGRVERLQRITSYREHLATWEVKKAQIDLLKKQLKAITDTIPYTMQDYFNIRVKYY
jgi:hypothetical protein